MTEDQRKARPVYRWSLEGPFAHFPTVGDALAAAAFARDLPETADTLHILRAGGPVEICAAGAEDGRALWLVEISRG